MPKVGERVTAVFGTSEQDEDTVEVFGSGVYEGDSIPTEAVGFLAEAAQQMKHKNPRIRLDNGKVVYGCECWWGSEKSVEKNLKGKKIVMVDINEARKKYLEDTKRK